TYCAGCHNGRLKSVLGTVLESFDTTRIPETAGVWSRAYRQMQAGTMPPVGAPRPDRATTNAVLASLENALGVGEPSPPADGHLLATRLAPMLWNTTPDAALLEAAGRNALADPATLEREVRRMLADDRALAFVSRFFFRWLQLDALDKADPDRKYFPDYDISL